MGKKNKKKKKSKDDQQAPENQEARSNDTPQSTGAIQTASQATVPCEVPDAYGKDNDSLKDLQACGGPLNIEPESDSSSHEYSDDESQDTTQGEQQECEPVGSIGVDLQSKALAACTTAFLENLKPESVLDFFTEADTFQPTTILTVRDIREQRTTSEKNRHIMETIRRIPSAYCVFKSALVKTGQVPLKRRLEGAEVEEHDQLAADVKDDTHSSNTRRQRDCSEKKLVQLAHHILYSFLKELGRMQCVCRGEEVCPILNDLICPENIELDSLPSIACLKPEQFKQFSDAVGEFKDGHYILMSPPTRPIPHLAMLGRVPWLAVLDYDQNGRADGLLAYVQKTIELQRSLAPTTWQDNCSFSEQSTSWISMLGCNEHPDTLTSKTFRDWREKVGSQIASIINELEEKVIGYTELTVVAIWPNEEETDLQRCMKHTLDRLENSRISPTIVVLCNENHKESQLPSNDNHDKLIAVPFSLNDLIISIHSILGSSDTFNGERQYSLPTSDNTKNPKIGIKDANTLKEDLAVLYIDNETNTNLSTAEIEDERDRFYRGGTLSWPFWYFFKSGGGHIDIERDINKEITMYIKENHIDKWKSGFVTLYHVPGSGGTTLAQRILWELKDKAPCAQVLHRADPDLLVEKVKLLCDRTQLPVILLLDGEDDQKIETIHKHLKGNSCVVFFRVRRCTYKPRLQKGDFYLKRKVSPREANVLSSLYIDQCQRLNKGEICKAQIQEIAEEVKSNIPHSIFDFGLALHDYQYKGIRSYVKSFILIEDDDSSELFAWQHALLLLSIAHYYGQISIPCHLFGRILKPKSKKVLNFSNLPQEMRELVVPGANEKHVNVIRISHYVIAKEIIDILLAQNRDTTFWDRQVLPTLSQDAKKRLEPVAVDLIKEAGYICNTSATDTIIKMLIRIFISRDNMAVGYEEAQFSHSIRPRFSRIMEDVSSHSPYSERFSILQQLTESFPEEAEFHAHLGRLYSKCRPEMQVEAEQCFKKALQVCDDDKYRNPPKDITKRKLNLRNIYHMYGNMYLARVTKYTGKYLDDKAVEQNVEEGIITEVLENAKYACENFGKSREVTPSGYETSYGYTDEIRVRLMFCDFAYRNAGFASIHDLAKTDQTDLGRFVRQCYVTLDELFADCVFSIDPSYTDEKTINMLQATHSVLFKPEGRALRDLEFRDDIDSWKMRVVLLKMKHGLRTSFGELDSVENADDIAEIVMYYERILDTYLKSEDDCNTRQLDIYFREWLFAIRHKLHVTHRISNILRYVEMWYHKHQTQTARFYLFILKTLYGFGSKTSHGNTEMLVESQNLMDELIRYSKFVQKPRYPREWLGKNADSFRRVISGYRFYGKIESRKVELLESNQLEILKGTIYANSKPLVGYISLDLPRSSGAHVKVFFVPAKSKMFGLNYNGRRVEFILGFSMKHGYEAFNVKELDTDACKNRKCRKGLEFRSCDKIIKCTRCGYESKKSLFSFSHD